MIENNLPCTNQTSAAGFWSGGTRDLSQYPRARHFDVARIVIY
ncbi:hypothetical protein ACNKHX_05755 [Shigella flexneri]